MSVTTTCGQVASAPATSSPKSAATPTTRRSLCASMRARTPSRTIRLSSARKTPIVGSWPTASCSTCPVFPHQTVSLPGGKHAKSGGASTHADKRPPPCRARRRPGDHRPMRYESCVTSLSWIPSEAVTGKTRAFFDGGFTHYDEPPPAALGDIEELQAEDRFRFANLLRAWIDVDGSGQITAGGYCGGGLMGATTVRLGSRSRTFQAVALPDLQHEPERGRDQQSAGAGKAERGRARSAGAGQTERGDGWMRFVQTAGGRTALPAPRPVRHPPFVQWQAPLVWTTLSLTLHADGHAEYEVAGASW